MHMSPSPSPPHSHPMDEWLNYSLSDLYLHPQQQESRSQMWTGGAPTHTEGSPPIQRPVAECLSLDPVPRQVQFNLDEDLGEAPSLPTDLANTTEEQADTPHHSASLNKGSSQLPHDDGHQHCPTHTRGA